MALPRAVGHGWAALSEGRWLDARCAFAARLAKEEAPEALEGLSWAAWWLDDEALLFESRTRAYASYRRAGDLASAGRMATWLAADEVDFHGARAVAAGWLRRAHRILDALEPGSDHGWLAFHEAYLTLVAGELDAAREGAIVAADVGRRFGSADLEMLGLALEGSVLVGSTEIDAGMERLDEATATALEGNAEIPISSAWTCCFLVSACTATRDHERAYAWCDRIAAFAERYGSRYMLAFCRSEYGLIHLWRGDWDAAETMLVDAIDDYRASRPAWVAAPHVTLAELRRRQGRTGEAAALLEDAGSGTSADVCRAWLALEARDTRRAVELARRALRRPPPRGFARLPALELLVRASTARGDVSEAETAASELADLAAAAGSTALRATAALATGIVKATRGEHVEALEPFEDATDDFERVGAPYEAASARVELGRSLLSVGRQEQATSELGAAAAAFRRLGAEGDRARAQAILDTVGGDSRPIVTRREREVLVHLASGLTNRQIADRLVVSEHTVHRHVTSIFRKLGVSTRTAAAAHAIRAGLVDEPD